MQFLTEEQEENNVYLKKKTENHFSRAVRVVSGWKKILLAIMLLCQSIIATAQAKCLFRGSFLLLCYSQLSAKIIAIAKKAKSSSCELL
jgi:hypothetical protein